MDWIRQYVTPVGDIEVVHERPWSTVSRVPVAEGAVFFKQCAPVQAHEPALTASLFERWPDRVPEVIAHDAERAWLLMADAGTRVKDLGNPPRLWLKVLPAYAELQNGEAAHVDEHLANGVPDLRLANLPPRYEELLRQELPLAAEEVGRLRGLAPTFAEWCGELDTHGIPPSIQHDDLHMNNLFADGTTLRIIDWGDATISHPFTSLVITYRFLEQDGLPPGHPWFDRLRDAYLEPWGGGFTDTFELALGVGAFARAIASARIRAYLPTDTIAWFDIDFAVLLRRALAWAQQREKP